MTSKKIFENKVGWFSDSCANEVIAKWGKLLFKYQQAMSFLELIIKGSANFECF